MQKNPNQRRDSNASKREDEITQRAVLALVLTEHPTQLTIPEIVRELGQSGRDAAERAIRDLVGVGLLRCGDDSVFPSRAALHFDWLDI